MAMETPNVESWIDFLQSGICGAEMESLRATIGTQRLRVLIIKILGWLKAEARSGKSCRPLEVSPTHEWVVDLQKALEVSDQFRSALTLSGTALSLHTKTSDSDQSALLKTVDQRFTPPLMR